jgi:8-oxo-dGTP pyrophosphatase MutT (NUDIX family)
VSPIRPDLVECLVFRVTDGGRVEHLLIRRADNRIFPGIWQPVTGGIEPGERVPLAALREVEEETGLGASEIEAFYDLDQVGSFFDEDRDEIVNSVIFALRVRPQAKPAVSGEHVDLLWCERAEAERLSVWPPYRDSYDLVERLVADQELARWFGLDPAGRRSARPPR